jgi:excisionase family DNA binding protein
MGINRGGGMMEADLVTTGEVAKALHVSEATVRTYASDGLIPCVKTFGGHRRFDLGQVLEAWAHQDDGVAISEEGTMKVEDLKPIKVSAAWKNDWAIGALRASDDEDHDDHADDLLHAEPFPGVRGKTRFVVSRRLVGV